MEMRPLPIERIGTRFSIRLKEPTGGYRDVVGRLHSESSVIDRHGVEKSFDPANISVWREIIERPKSAGKGSPLTMRIFELDQICNETWPALHSLEIEGWLLRSANGVTNRANSVLPLAEAFTGGLLANFDQRIADIKKYYSEQNLPVIFQIALPSAVPLLERLIELGGERIVSANTMVADLIEEAFELPSNFELLISSQAESDWLMVQPTPGLAEIINGCPATYLSLKKDGQFVAATRIAITQSWSSITRVFVDSNFRGLGLGKLIVKAALRESIKQGAKKAVLQVEQTNQVAIEIYQAAGFNFHHEYTYVEMK
jgi:GNAT superfamily N-acetyltransferase